MIIPLTDILTQLCDMHNFECIVTNEHVVIISPTTCYQDIQQAINYEVSELITTLFLQGCGALNETEITQAQHKHDETQHQIQELLSYNIDQNKLIWTLT